jgi:hypothetical protein
MTARLQLAMQIAILARSGASDDESARVGWSIPAAAALDWE